MTHEHQPEPAENSTTAQFQRDPDYYLYLDTSRITGHESGKNLRLALPNPVLDIIVALCEIDSETHPDITLGVEIRTAIMLYGDMRRREPGFSAAMARATERVQARLAPALEHYPAHVYSPHHSQDHWPDSFTQIFSA
jgi:hypothetical protein